MINQCTSAVDKNTAMGVASKSPDVCDEARLFMIEVSVTITLQLSQLVPLIEANESPNPMNERT
jgi:hypothetical protein